MCARRPTSAMPKPFLCCERAFCRSMVVMCRGGDVTCFDVMRLLAGWDEVMWLVVRWRGVVMWLVATCHVMSCHVMWCYVMWWWCRWCDVMWSFVLCHVTWCNAMSGDVLSCDELSSVVLCSGMECYELVMRLVVRWRCALLYSTLLYSTLPYPTLLYSTRLDSTLLYYSLLYYSLLFSILFSSLLFSTLLYSTLLYSNFLLYSTLLYSSQLFWSSSDMKRPVQWAEQQESSSNFTKYCACHAKWISWLIRVTYKTSSTMRGATGVILQLHQILRLQRNSELYRFQRKLPELLPPI